MLCGKYLYTSLDLSFMYRICIWIIWSECCEVCEMKEGLPYSLEEINESYEKTITWNELLKKTCEIRIESIMFRFKLGEEFECVNYGIVIVVGILKVDITWRCVLLKCDPIGWRLMNEKRKGGWEEGRGRKEEWETKMSSSEARFSHVDLARSHSTYSSTLFFPVKTILRLTTSSTEQNYSDDGCRARGGASRSLFLSWNYISLPRPILFPVPDKQHSSFWCSR